MDKKTLQKAKTLEIQIDECQITIDKLNDLGAMRYITFESLGDKTVQISGHLKPSLVNALLPLILEEIRSLKSIYEHELRKL